MLSDIDRQWMKAALQEAEKGWGLCSPNPMVGAVIAEGDRERLVALLDEGRRRKEEVDGH